MLQRLKNTWRPENFHLHHMIGRGEPCFEGWYFKLVDKAGAAPYAIIPGVFLGADAHAFIQVLDGIAATSAYHRFPLSEFQAASDAFDIQIGRSRFTRSSIHLDIDPNDTSCQQQVQGSVQFEPWHGWPVTLTRPGVMGPYGFIPFMECNHGILSMDHGISGHIAVDGVTTSFDDGRGYVEKDWGKGFPRGYLWLQSNHFGEPGISIVASVARIPWLRAAFRGHLIGVLLNDRLYRFTTYTGSEIEHISIEDNSCRLVVRDKNYRLEISASRSGGGLLYAPYEKQMIERVAESMTSTVDIRLQHRRDKEIIFQGSGTHGCLEVQGDIDSILHN